MLAVARQRAFERGKIAVADEIDRVADHAPAERAFGTDDLFADASHDYDYSGPNNHGSHYYDTCPGSRHHHQRTRRSHRRLQRRDV